MGDGEVGSLYISIGAHMDEALKAIEQVKKELAGVEGATKSAEDKFKKFSETCKTVGQQFKDFGKPLMIAGAAITGAFAIAIKKTADMGDEFKDLSQRTGIAVETLSSFKLAADKSGTSVQGFAMGMKGLSRVMYEAASGGKEAQETFASIGVAAVDSAGNLRPLDQVMLDVADRFAGMADGAEKNALAMKLFGKSGMDLIPMLNLGRKGLQANIDAMQKFGVVTREEAEAGDAFNDAMKDLGAATSGLSRAIAGTLIPAITKLAEGAAGVVAKISEWAREHRGLTTILAGSTLAIGTVAAALGTLAFGIGTVIAQLPKLIAGFKAIKAIALNPIVITIAVAIPVLTKALSDFKSGFTNMRDAMKEAGSSGFISFLEGVNSGIRKVALGIKDSNIALSEANDKFISLKGAGILLGDVFRAVKGAIEGAATPAAQLAAVFANFGLKTKTELVVELKAAEDALKTLRGSIESTPGSIKALEDKIASLKEAMTGARVETRSLNEQLGLTLRIDLEKKYRDMLAALTAYKGKLTEAGEKKLIEDLIALRAELDGTKPSVISLDDTLATFFENIANGISDADVEQIGIDFSDMARQAQEDIERFTQGAADDINNLVGSADAVEAKFKLIGDAMGVSANTIRVALYNIQAEFLRTIGIIVPLIESIPTVTAPAIEQTRNYFDGLFNDIASGFGNTIQTWLTGATTFRDFIKGIWEDIKGAFFRVVGEMVAEWTVKFVKKLISDAADVGESIAKSISGALGGAGATAGKMASSFLTAASSIANIVTAIASVISLLKSPPTGAGDGMGRVVERQDQQTAILGSIIEFMRVDIRWGMQTSIKVLENIAYTQLKTANSYLKSMDGTLKGLQGASSGAVLTSPQLVMTHGTPSRPEFILPEPNFENLLATGPNRAPTASAAHIINLSPVFHINAIDRTGVETFLKNEAKPILQDMLNHYDLRTPVTAG